MAILRILLADDHAVLRDGLAMLVNGQPDMQVVAQAADGLEAVRLAELHAPDVAVLDVSMPTLGGADAAERIRSVCPDVRVLALTRHAEQGYLRRLLAAGAKGYVLKRTAGDALIDAIRIVASGGTYVDPALSAGLVDRNITVFGRQAKGAHDCPQLSNREIEVLRLIAWGLSNKEVAGRLGISIKTIESHKASAVDKLRLRGRSDILRYAMSQNWLAEDNAP